MTAQAEAATHQFPSFVFLFCCVFFMIFLLLPVLKLIN